MARLKDRSNLDNFWALYVFTIIVISTLSHQWQYERQSNFVISPLQKAIEKHENIGTIVELKTILNSRFSCYRAIIPYTSVALFALFISAKFTLTKNGKVLLSHLYKNDHKSTSFVRKIFLSVPNYTSLERGIHIPDIPYPSKHQEESYYQCLYSVIT